MASGSGPPPWSLPVNPVPQASPEDGFTGFLVGAGEGLLDYRSAALIHHLGGRGGGILGVIETTGQGALRLRDMAEEAQGAEYPPLPGPVEVLPTEVAFLLLCQRISQHSQSGRGIAPTQAFACLLGRRIRLRMAQCHTRRKGGQAPQGVTDQGAKRPRAARRRTGSRGQPLNL